MWLLKTVDLNPLAHPTGSDLGDGRCVRRFGDTDGVLQGTRRARRFAIAIDMDGVTSAYDMGPDGVANFRW